MGDLIEKPRKEGTKEKKGEVTEGSFPALRDILLSERGNEEERAGKYEGGERKMEA